MSKFNIKQLSFDRSKEQNGVWVDENGIVVPTPEGDGLFLKIARLGNPGYKEHLRKLGKPHQRKIRKGNVKIELVEELSKKAIAKHVLLDWKNLQDENEKGKLVDVPFSEKKALEYLKQYEEFYEMVVEFATDAELFRQELQEDSEGN